jgi:tetratricopeptide (TPR) repeat protein
MTAFRALAVVTLLTLGALPVWHAIRVSVSDRSVAAAERAIKGGDPDAAVDHMYDAVNWDPKNAKKRALLGNALLLAGEPLDAAEELKLALTDPKDTAASFNLGVAHHRLGDYALAGRYFDETERRYRARLARDPRNAETMFALGRFYQVTGKYREALDCFIKVAMLDKGNPKALAAIDAMRRQALRPVREEGGA